MDIKENAAYLKGLYDGYELDATSKEGKLIGQMLDLISKLSERICDLEAECEELRDIIDEIDEDLGAVETDLYVDDGDNYDPDFEEDFEDDFDDSEYDEFVCPTCGEVIYVDENAELADVVCPACGEKMGDIELCDGNCEGCTEDCEN